MIIYQTNPCRLYPQINTHIKEQFNNSINIHEVFELVDDSQSEDPNNKLKISKKTHKFHLSPRTDFLYGIFNINKIVKKKDDFLFTIIFDKKHQFINQETTYREYITAIRYFSSTKYLERDKDKIKDESVFVISDYNLCLYTLMEQFNKYSDEELMDFIRNREDIIVKYKNIKYKLRNDIFDSSSNFDYIGSYTDFEQTIEDLKRLINLDLSDMVGARTLSHQ